MPLTLLGFCGLALAVAISFLVVSCSDKINTPDTAEHLSAFHEQYYSEEFDELKGDNLSLYVDYSTCIAMGQNSNFFRAMIPAMTDATMAYFAIEGKCITEHDADSTYNLLRLINEVDYADLKTAVERMADGNSESLLLTDGEFFQQNATRDNLRNPYMANAFKKWILRGHDIYFVSEPYVEQYKGKLYNKKRFYILFTDNRLNGNFYERILRLGILQNFPDVEIFHLAADHPSVLSPDGKHSKVNSVLQAKVRGIGNMEIQSWEVDWKNGIKPLVVQAVDQKTGEPLPNGDYILKDIKVDRNSMGAFRITNVVAKVSNVNEAYSAFVTAKENKVKPDISSCEPWEVDNFIKLDSKEFDKHGEIVLYFDKEMYDPSSLDGKPYNYTKIDICVDKVESVFGQYEDKFNFESITMSGELNVSISESIKQCIADPKVQDKVKQTPIYSIYIQSSAYKE